MSQLSLTFLGAAGTVTGSKHLLQIGDRRVLVDCGLFQGLKELRLRNWDPLPVDPASVDAVVLTHAHLDHCGYLPRFVAGGFRGRIFCTPATKELCSLVLPDSAHIQEEDARDANRGRYSKHTPALPLYTVNDAARALGQLLPVGYNRPIPLFAKASFAAPRATEDGAGTEQGRSGDGAGTEPTVEFIDAGHLLGSAYARIQIGDRTLLFGGDLGRYGRPVLPDPSTVAEADVLLLESTYGDRLHDPDDNGDRLAAIIQDTVRRGGKVVIPSFAIGRVEEVLYWLKRLEEEKRIPLLPVFVDSPMATAALAFYSARLHELDPDLKPGAQRVSAFATTRMTLVSSPQQSADLTASREPSIVISASGMATGGRVLHHLAATLPDPKNTVLFVGYQAAGTRGRRLCDGEKTLKMLGRIVPVAARIERIDSMSAHADAGEIMRWLGGFTRPPRMTYLVHGEPIALDALAARIAREKSWPVHVAQYHETVELGEYT
jgi:metallo-beta-lactamase family protein